MRTSSRFFVFAFTLIGAAACQVPDKSFVADRYTLTVARAGSGVGTVTSTPAGIACGGFCSGVYDDGTSVTLTATPTEGRFAGWTGGGCAGTDGCTVTVTSDVDVAAAFELIAVTDVSTSTANGLYTAPAAISIQVTFTDPVAVGTAGGTPALALNSGAVALYTGGSGTPTLTFTYTVAPGQLSVDLDATGTNALTLEGGSIADVDGNRATLTLPAPGSPTSLGGHAAIAIDSVAPVVSAITGPTGYVSATNATLAYTLTETNPGTTNCTQTAGSGMMPPCTNTEATLASLDEGEHTVRVTHTDLAGNVSAAVAHTWTVDTVAPVVSAITGPAAFVNSTNATLSYTVAELNPAPDGTTCTQTVGTGDMGLCSETGVSFINLSAGGHTVAVTHRDLAGNVSVVRTYAWTVDTVAPVLSAITGPAAYIRSTDATLAYTVMDANPGTTTCTQLVGTGTMTSCTSSGATFVSLSQGLHTVRITHTDAAGNAAPPRTYSWTVDTVAPVISSITGPASYTSATDAALAYSIAEANPGLTTCDQTVGTGVRGNCTDAGVTYSALSEGAHLVTVTHTDLAGNVATARTYAWTVDTIVPVVSNIVGPPSPSLATSATMTYTVAETNPDTTACSLTGPGNKIRCDATTAIYDGLGLGGHTLSVTHTDRAGNLSAARTFTWSVCPRLSADGGGFWTYKRSIAIVGSVAGGQVNYVVPVVIDTAALVGAGKLRANGADLRFANASGAELTWWLESGINTPATKVWVKVDQIPAAGATIDVYYGNPSATMAGAYVNNGRSTFTMFDDFEGGSLDPARWVRDGVYALPPQVGGALHSYVAGPPYGLAAETLSTVTGGTVAEFNMTVNNTPNPGWKSDMWEVRVGAPGMALTAPIGWLRTGWWSNGVQDCPAVNGTYLGRAEVDATAGTWSLYLGSTLCATQTGISFAAPYVYYVMTQGDPSITVDLWDFRVRSLVLPEPVAGAPGAEQPAC